MIAQRLYRHLKRTPGTHKLGVLYVVDSVTRQWIEKARASGQDLSGTATVDGTFASGVHKITELLPALIDDLIQNAPADHKVCELVAYPDYGPRRFLPTNKHISLLPPNHRDQPFLLTLVGTGKGRESSPDLGTW